MSMKYSLKLGKPFGIKVSIHWTFLLLIAWIVIIDIQQGLNAQQVLLSVLFILTLFVCVTLHEFGHALTAQQYGGEVRSITLLPIGGMANITKMPEKPGQELVVSVAGLIVNVIIAAILWVILSAAGNLDLQQIEFKAITSNNFFIMLMLVNLFIVAFNLIPAFPMDGGRILRAALAFKMDRVKATRVAKNIGQLFAVGFVIFGLFINPFLVIIGIFVYLGAQAEYETIRFRQALNNYEVKDALITDVIKIHPDDPLQKVADLMIHHSTNGFIVTGNDDMHGFVSKNNIIEGLTRYGKDEKVKEVMKTDVETVELNTPLQEVFQLMQQKKYNAMPVLSKGRIKGIINMENLNEFMLVQNAIH